MVAGVSQEFTGDDVMMPKHFLVQQMDRRCQESPENVVKIEALARLEQWGAEIRRGEKVGFKWRRK